MHPLREFANGEMGTVRVHVSFSMADLAQIKQQLGRYSENPSQFIEGFEQVSIMFDLARYIYCINSLLHPGGKELNLGGSPRVC